MSSSKATWLALIALAEAELPEPTEVVTMLSGQAAETVPELVSRTTGMATFRWGEATIAYTLVPRPIADSQTAGPCATAWYWPEAARALAGHRAHLLVTLVDEGRDAIEKCMRLTSFLVALAEACRPLALFWAPAGLVHEPSAFAQQASQMNRENLPLYLWIGFRLDSLADGRRRIFTTGLEAFDRKELEIEAHGIDAQQILDDIYNVTHYVLEESSSVKDADTIGLSDGRQLRAHHQESLLGDGRQIVRLQYEAAS